MGDYQLDEHDLRMLEQAQPRFYPPYAALAPAPEAFLFQWAKLTYVFGLPDPAEFPPLPTELSARDRASVERYIHACQELASYSLLSTDGGVSINVVNGEPQELKVEGPPKESLRGFSVLFRQMHSDKDEPASYTVVKNVLGAASRSAEDGLAATRLDFIKQWNAARAKLLQFTLADMARSKMYAARSAPPEFTDIKREHSPMQLISLFNYGEYIHWGKRRDDHRSAFEDPLGGALLEFQFHESLIGLSHFYLGFAKVLEAATGTDS